LFGGPKFGGPQKKRPGVPKLGFKGFSLGLGGRGREPFGKKKGAWGRAYLGPLISHIYLGGFVLKTGRFEGIPILGGVSKFPLRVPHNLAGGF